MSGDNTNIPNHIAFIVDGNRRWAKRKNLPTIKGHIAGKENLEKVIDRAKKSGIKAITAWVFSTENWNRSEEEVNALFDLLRTNIDEYKEKFIKEKTRFIHLGRKDVMPTDIVEKLNSMVEETKHFTDFMVGFAMDYGGHDELIRAFKKVNELGIEITEENIEKCLDTAEMPQVDFIIRTSGEQRLSGFMSWQNHYAEFYFPEVTFPDFDDAEFDKALADFAKRERRFGGNAKK